ncbi:hypothetical protein [Calidifontibacter terrae]
MDKWWVIGIVIAVVLAGAGLLATWWWGNRRTRLGIEVLVTKLVAADDVPGLTVTWHGGEIAAPHLTEVTFTNLGPGDIQPSAFDGGECYVAFTDATVVTLLGTTGQVAETDGTWNVQLTPMLLTRGESARMRVLSAGRAVEQGRGVHLADVSEATRTSDEERMSGERFQRVVIAASLASLAAALVASFISALTHR